MKKEKNFPAGFEKLDSLDFVNNKSKLILSYVLRLAGLFVFVALFSWIAKWMHPDLSFTLNTFLRIALDDIPGWVSIILVTIEVILVLYLHELIHAAVFYLDHDAPPKIGIRGPLIFAAIPGYLNRRNVMIINALAPFVVVSMLGIILIGILPLSFLPWIFIPTVINAAAAGCDFMTVIWLLGLPQEAVIEDNGDTLVAYLHTARR